MPNFTAGTSFTDGVTNDVTAAKLNALVADAVPTSSLSLNSTTGTISLFSSGTGTAATPAIQPTGDTNTGIFFPAADTIAFSEGGAESMRIDSSGNVGIGTSPSRKLDVNGVAGATYLMLTSNTASAPAADAAITRPADGTLGLITNSTERLRIDSSGNVGIGTTSPAGKLHVNGQTYIQGTVSGGLASSTLIANSSGQAQFWGLGPDVSTTGSMTFVVSRSNLTSSIQALTIDSSGNVGIGTTSPGAKFGVSDGTVNIQLSPDSANSRGVIGTAGAHSIAFAPNGSTRLTIDQANGTLTSQPTYDNTATGSAVIVTSTGLVRRTSSSIKYKKDIENLYGSIVDNAISNLRPVWYRTKNPEGDDKSTWSHVGLIAEEVNSVEPRLVKYKTVEVSIGENGERIETQLENPIPEDVDYAKLSVILLSEVKAQKAKIASLEARIEALESA